MLGKCTSGILLPVSSLPSTYGIGDLGPEAYRFVDFLKTAKQSFWQILPLNPIDPDSDYSPYHSSSAFAFNPLFISPEILYSDGYLQLSDIKPFFHIEPWKIDYPAVIHYKEKLFEIAFQNLQSQKKKDPYEGFCHENSIWLDDYCHFVALRKRFPDQTWNFWPIGIKRRDKKVLHTTCQKLEMIIEKVKFLQYLFFQQWVAVKEYANQNGIEIIGDIPIYVTYNSADCWTHPEIFKLNKKNKPVVVSGVPPDYFSETGQLWGNPLYNWNGLQESGFKWWIQRLQHNMKLYDLIRIDHFRGFVAYWEVSTREKTAIKGKWKKALPYPFFNQVKTIIPDLQLIAEDLGYITPDVHEVMNHFGFPGMKILQFGFDDDLSQNPHFPKNLSRNCFFYTGTHDNNTLLGWFQNEATKTMKENLFSWIGRKVPVKKLPWELIRLVMISVANTTIFPIQDILGLGEEHRMNRPGTYRNNWRWKLEPGYLTEKLAKKLAEMTEISGRG